jgi:hypothetical protein
MFTSIKNFFFGTGTTEQVPDGISTENVMRATIMNFEQGNGFGLFDTRGELIGKYSRRRDALRGAARRGLVVA